MKPAARLVQRKEIRAIIERMGNADVSRAALPHNPRFKAFLLSSIPLLAFFVLTFDKEKKALHLLISATSFTKTEVRSKRSGGHETGEGFVGLQEERSANDNATSSDALRVPDKATFLDPDGPVPVIIMSLGRSGSTSICQAICKLTGSGSDEFRGCNLREEFPGSSEAPVSKFFATADREGRWLFDRLREKQKRYPATGVVGFKWKPYALADSPAARGALRAVAASKFPTVKVVRSQRNPLDCIISTLKHTQANLNHKKIPPHCHPDDAKCINKHVQAGRNLVLPTEDLVETLRNQTNWMEEVDQMLIEMKVSHISVTYEELHFGRNREEEWMKIFRFLGVGPGEGLTKSDLDLAMQEHALTSSTMHNVTLKNFDEVKDVLSGTEYERLLH